jgi:two-component system cell cycle response regulator
MYRILVADDDTDLLLLLESILRKAGYEVTCYSEPCTIVNSKCDWPDLFVLDKNMKVIDGFALSKYLKLNALTKNIPIVMISAIPEYETKALDIGVSYFMSKPLNTTKLLEVIGSLLSAREVLANESP